MFARERGPKHSEIDCVGQVLSVVHGSLLDVVERLG